MCELHSRRRLTARGKKCCRPVFHPLWFHRICKKLPGNLTEPLRFRDSPVNLAASQSAALSLTVGVPLPITIRMGGPEIGGVSEMPLGFEAGVGMQPHMCMYACMPGIITSGKGTTHCNCCESGKDVRAETQCSHVHQVSPEEPIGILGLLTAGKTDTRTLNRFAHSLSKRFLKRRRISKCLLWALCQTDARDKSGGKRTMFHLARKVKQ